MSHRDSYRDRGRETVRTGHKKRVTCVSWNSNGLYLATGGADKEVIIHKHVDEKQLFSKQGGSRQHLRAHEAGISWLSWNSVDPTMLASASEDKMIFFWNVHSPSRPTHTFKLGVPVTFFGWSQNGNILCCVLDDSSLLLLDRQRPKKTIQKQLDFRVYEAHFANHDNCLILTRESKLEILDCTDLENLHTIASINVAVGQVKTLDIDKTHSFLVTGSNDGVVSFWSTANLTCSRSMKFTDRDCAMTIARLSGDSSMLACAGDDQRISISYTHRIEIIASIDHRANRFSMCWNPKYNVLAYTAIPAQAHYSSDYYETCRLWFPPRKN